MEILLSHNVLRASLITLSVLENGESCISEWLLDASGWVCRLWRLRDCSSAVVWMSATLDSVSHSRGEQRSLVWQALPQAVNLCSLCSGEKNKPFQSSSEKPTLSIGVHRTHCRICFAQFSTASFAFFGSSNLNTFVWLRKQIAYTLFCTSVSNRMS